jgi:RNA polymerase sigma-70 factor (ECF subfamily)
MRHSSVSDVWADTARGFDEFFAADYERIVARLATTLRDPELARDSVAEAVSRAWEHEREGKSVDNLPGWIHTVALNCARDTLRRRANGKKATARLACESVLPAGENLLADLDMDNALARLAPRQREIARLRFVHDLSYDQIGAQLGIAPGTVKNVLRRVRYVLLATM